MPQNARSTGGRGEHRNGSKTGPGEVTASNASWSAALILPDADDDNDDGEDRPRLVGP